jgi:predicted short-subunit dehydrogenase-like oxidoreductase (DUF2520 family)
MSQATTPPGHAPLGVAIVGAGRLGSALAGALRAAGVDVEGPLGRDALPQARVTLLCVPDQEIAGAATRLGELWGREPSATSVDGTGRGEVRGARLIGHVSGATPLTALAGAGADAFGLHPLQTFAGGEGPEAFDGIGAAVAGTSPAALAVARDLATRLGMAPIEISDGERAAYHAAASIASNFLVALQAAAERVAGAAGIEPSDARALLAPLVRSTVDNWAERGPAEALTGPVARGDHATVVRQRDAVERHAPDLVPLFDELVACTAAVARGEAGGVDPTGRAAAGAPIPEASAAA